MFLIQTVKIASVIRRNNVATNGYTAGIYSLLMAMLKMKTSFIWKYIDTSLRKIWRLEIQYDMNHTTLGHKVNLKQFSVLPEEWIPFNCFSANKNKNYCVTIVYQQ